ncbi:hypothetical protein HDU96_005045, partial [Phlyctochytrium bullatum]
YTIYDVLVEDFEYSENIPFIVYRLDGVVKVRYLDEVVSGELFVEKNVKEIVLAAAKILWRRANLENMDNELVQWSGKTRSLKSYPDGSQEGSRTFTKGIVLTDWNPLVRGGEESEEVYIRKIIEDPNFSLKQAKEVPPLTSRVLVSLTERTPRNGDVKKFDEKVIQAEIALTESEQRVVDFIFRNRRLCGTIRALTQQGLSVFSLLRNAIDPCFTWATVDNVEEEEIPVEVPSGDESDETAAPILTPREKARAEFLASLEAAAKGCQAFQWHILNEGEDLAELKGTAKSCSIKQ